MQCGMNIKTKCHQHEWSAYILFEDWIVEMDYHREGTALA